jgi:hypothetical protein
MSRHIGAASFVCRNSVMMLPSWSPELARIEWLARSTRTSMSNRRVVFKACEAAAFVTPV